MEKETYLRHLSAALDAEEYPPHEKEKCMEYAASLLDRGLPVLFDEKHVFQVLKWKSFGFYAYHEFPLQQRRKIRYITAPCREIKRRQKWILTEILDKVPVSEYAHGFEIGRSIKTNAMIHSNSPYVLCLDIESFFPSITEDQIQKVFRSIGYSNSASYQLADICCYRGFLPQGAPTSPKLSNILFAKTDHMLAALAHTEGCIYSRYADDLTFSGNHDIHHIIPLIEKILGQEGFYLNKEKIHYYAQNEPKRITGLVVQNGSVRIPKQFKRKLKQEIYFCQKYGVLTHLSNASETRVIHYREHLYGKAYFVQMIEPQVGSAFLDQLDQIPWPQYERLV